MKLLSTFFLLAFLFTSQTYADSAIKNGCQAAADFLAVAEVYQIAEPIEGSETLREMRAIKLRACNGEYSSSATVYYQNGRTATNLAGSASATWYWPNGNTITNLALSDTATVYYPNQRTVSSLFRRVGASFYHPNGRTMSNLAGQAGATIYDFNGKTITNNGPAFNDNGKLDVASYLEYVSALSSSNPAPPTCNPSQIKDLLNRTIELIRAGSGQQAIDILVNVKTCY